MFVSIFLEANVRKEIEKLARKRADGEGSIYKRTVSRKDGTSYIRWEAVYQLGYDGNGNRKRITRYSNSQAGALRKLEEIKKELASGASIEEKRTVSEYLKVWLKDKALTVKPRTVEFYTYHVNKYITPELGSIKLKKLTTPQVRAFMRTTQERVSKDAANKSRTVLKAALEQAVKDELLIRNPVTAVDPFKIEKKVKDIEWSSEEALEFLDHARAHRLFAAFHLALSTGMRHGEVLGLRWQDIEGDTLYVRQSLIRLESGCAISTPKTAQSIRPVKLDPETIAVLEQHKQKQQAEAQQLGDSWGPASPEFSDLVFTSLVGGEIVPRNFDRVWYNLQKQAGVRRIRFHDLRHMYVSLLNKQGVDARTIADRIGHTDPTFTLRRYAHVFDEQRQGAAIPLQKLLSSNKNKSN